MRDLSLHQKIGLSHVNHPNSSATHFNEWQAMRAKTAVAADRGLTPSTKGIVSEFGELRLTGDDAIANQILTADCQRHEVGDAIDAACWHVRCAAVTILLASARSASDVELANDHSARTE
jgi:hypothetical protein